MTTPKNNENKQWQLIALTEALGELELTVDDKLTIGRGKDNDVVLGSKQVSRQHAELSVSDGTLQVTDLGSANGTLVNDAKIEPNIAQPLSVDDVVSFAVFSFKVGQKTGASSHKVHLNKDAITEESVALDSVAEKSVTENPVTQDPVSKVSMSKETVSKDDVKSVQSVEPVAETIDQPIKAETVEQINETKLEEALEAELEEPIPYGNPNQDTAHPGKVQKLEEGTEDNDAVNEKIVKSPQSNISQHNKELAEEADPDVLRAKQAATAKMSATAETHVEKTQTAPESFNTMSEQEQHDVAHVKKPDPVRQSAKKGSGTIVFWIVLILLALGVAIWLFNSGALA